ncbi:S-layer homology domain-containing protein [Paenibacillus silviterrae]|uniref:S-layer homology domain-containing protein n=1 Tax=Paenibacillus silviterrae TaxID=3242194 RepID=UPI002543161C|nr:S-layer homology domain-containing protein [Paenibacillus chinjuensis]
MAIKLKCIMLSSVLFSSLFLSYNNPIVLAESNPDTQILQNTETNDPVSSLWNALDRNPSDLSGHWSERIFQWAILIKIINGYPDGTYRPDQPISEAEFLKTFYSAFGYPPNKSNNDADWTEAPYRLARLFKHPVSIQNNDKHSALTKSKAAEITASAQGVNYRGDDAIRYLLIKFPATKNIFDSLKEMKGNDQLTRAEAINLIRIIKLQGVTEIKNKPTNPSDSSLLLSDNPEQLLEESEDFTFAPVSYDDFRLSDTKKPEAFIYLEQSKEAVEQIYGTSEGIFSLKEDKYGPILVHYNSAGLVDSWLVDGDILKNQEQFQTKKGIVLNQSTFFDVLTKYGTGGYIGDGYSIGISIDYLYENINGTFIPRISKKEIQNPANAIVLSFYIDKKNMKVDMIICSSYYFAYIFPLEQAKKIKQQVWYN